MPNVIYQNPGRVHILRVFAAIAYDAVALGAIWFLATLVVVIALRGAAVDPGNIFFSVYLLLFAYLYFAWSWTRSGQTLGMKSWRFAVVANDTGATIDWRCAARRFLGAILSWSVFGLGFVWAIFDSEHRSWHDQISRSCLRRV